MKKKAEELERIKTPLEIAYYVLSILPSVVGFFIHQLHWGILISIIIAIFVLFFLHIQQNKKEGIRKRISGILLLLFFLILILVQFFPTPNQFIQNIYWDARSDNELTDSTTTQAVTPSLSSQTSTVAGFQANSSETDITATPQTTLITTPDNIELFYGLSDNCLTEQWIPWPNIIDRVTLEQTEHCRDYSIMGIFTNEYGLQFYSKENQNDNYYGLITQIPDENTKVSFKLKIDDLKANNFDDNAELIFGLINAEEKDINGKLLVITAYDHDELPQIRFIEYPLSKGKITTVSNEMEIGQDLTIIMEKYRPSFDLYIIGLDKPLEITDIPNKDMWNGFFIGYKAPVGSAVSAFITDFQMTNCP